MCRVKDHNCFAIAHWQDGVRIEACWETRCRNRQRPPSAIDCNMAPGVVCEGCGKYWIPADVSDETLTAMKAEFAKRGIRPADNSFVRKDIPLAA